MDKMNEGVVNMPVVCPIIRDMRCNKCDYPQLRRELSFQMREGCACAGKGRNECVLRHIYMGDMNIVQRVLFHEEFKACGDKDPTAEIRQAIRAYEEQRTLVSRVTRWIKSTLGGVFSFNVRFPRSMRRVLP